MDGAPRDEQERLLSRRALLAGAAAGGTLLALGTGEAGAAVAGPLRTDPFALGVASGDPLPHRVMLWTRLVRNPFDAHSMPRHHIDVEWEISRHPRFHGAVRRGTVRALPRVAHSVHVDVAGLEPGTDYWYRFRAGSYVSPLGRTRTAPARDARLPRLRLGVANCQDWQNGYWPAYAALAREDLDVVLHLGDYIYESDPAGIYPDRKHPAPVHPGLNQLLTLGDYRNRHALYKTDPALQATHAAFPWVVTWDDHEVEGNYANLRDTDARGPRRQDPARFRQERANAYQAYWEHMPIRVPYRLGSSHLRLYRRFDFGRLLRLAVLDTRQYRSDQPGHFPGDRGPESFGISNVGGSLLGQTQEGWLHHSLRSSAAQWSLVAQQVMMSRLRFPLAPGQAEYNANMDMWAGYVPARNHFLEFLAAARVRNPVVLAGDLHAACFSEVRRNPDDPASPLVAAEYVAPSISSSFAPTDDAVLKADPSLNPAARYFDGARHGYLRIDVDRARMQVEHRAVDSIATRVSPVRTIARFVTEAGRPGIQPG